MKCPCQGCDIRRIGCHGWCDAYKEYRAKLDDIRTQEARDRPLKEMFIDRAIQSARKKKSIKK